MNCIPAGTRRQTHLTTDPRTSFLHLFLSPKK